MSRAFRIERPPSTGIREFDNWASRLYDALNGLPPFSIFSGVAALSTLTAPAGTLGINIASSGSRLWINASGTTSSWTFIHYG